MLPMQRNLLKRLLDCALKSINSSSCRSNAVITGNRHWKCVVITDGYCTVYHRKFVTSLSKLNTETVKQHVQTHTEPKSSHNQETRDKGQPQDVDWLLTTEMEKYELGKRWLATMMGEDVETFTDEKIAEAIQYLFPSHLFAKDARPGMKDPLQLFGKRKETQMGPDGRPLHTAFFTGQPAYHELIFRIWENLEKLDNIQQEMKKFKEEDTKSFYYDKPLLVRWMKQHELEDKLSCRLRQDQYDLLIRRLTRIVKHPLGEKLQDFLSEYQIELSQGGKKIDIAEIDEDGYATVMGYRKTAVAEVRLKEGSGKTLINNMPMTKFFNKFIHRQQVLYPFMVTDQLGRFDADIGVIGGGETGKAGAIRLGISRALLSFSQSFYEPLEDAGLLKRDFRQVERKKPGRKKARRKFAWVKR